MKNKKTKKQNISIKEMFGFSLERAQGVMHTCPTLHVNSLGDVTVENCHAVLTYTENEICFDMKELSVCIKGDGIVMNSMEKNMITVHGRIFSIEFNYNKER